MKPFYKRLFYVSLFVCIFLGVAIISLSNATFRRSTQTPNIYFTATPAGTPLLQSDKYLKDTSLLAKNVSCSAPCFRGITPGRTTFADALTKIKADPAFSNVQSQDPKKNLRGSADWSTKDGLNCCQLASTTDGVVSAMLIKVAPNMTAQQMINNFGTPKFVNPVEYSDKDVAIAMVYPVQGLVVWCYPGDVNSKLVANSPVIMLMFFDPGNWESIEDTSTLQGWNGFLPYKTYRNATPIVTPKAPTTVPTTTPTLSTSG
ncbi:MAG: hypothetical protein ABI947_29290 [Chloroflexota bacterium]